MLVSKLNFMWVWFVILCCHSYMFLPVLFSLLLDGGLLLMHVLNMQRPCIQLTLSVGYSQQ